MSELYFNFFDCRISHSELTRLILKVRKMNLKKNETGNNALLLSLDELDDSTTRRKVIKKYYSAVFR